LLSFTFISNSQIQTLTENPCRKEKIQTEGESEKESIKNYFKKHYKPQIHEKYSGHVSIDTLKDIINFDSIAIRLNLDNEVYQDIFTLGLITGQMLGGSISDTISINYFEELTYIKTKKHQRRFKLLVFHNWYMNPNVFLIELTNIQSSRKSEIKSFLNGAELTFIVNPWNQI